MNITVDRKVIEQALEALNYVMRHGPAVQKAKDLLQDALEQPEQEPWVGLTEDQFLEASRLAEEGNYMVAFQRIQQWLKEKNT